MIYRRKNQAFTIVELLVVVVVIAILATISIVAYNGITGDAREKALQSELHDVQTKVMVYFRDEGQFPASLMDVGVENDALNYTSTIDEFCVEGSANSKSFYITESGSLKEGECPA